MRRGFTLIELLVAVAVLALLAALAVPLVQRALERGRVAKVLVDLQSVEVALEAYFLDHNAYPPVTVSCQGADAEEVLQLPQELADGGYLPKSANSKTSALLMDPFHPGSTYKYTAPETYWLNGQKFGDRYPVWVPDDFPRGEASTGRWMSDADTPLAWGIWSIGPRPITDRTLGQRIPAAQATWYAGYGTSGVIGRYRERFGAAHSTLPRK